MASPHRPIILLLLLSIALGCLSWPVDQPEGFFPQNRIRTRVQGRGGRVPLRRGLPSQQEDEVELQEEGFGSRPLYRSSQVFLGSDRSSRREEALQEGEVANSQKHVKPELKALLLKSGELSARARGLSKKSEEPSEIVQNNRHKKQPFAESSSEDLEGDNEFGDQGVESPRSANAKPLSRDALAYGQLPQVPEGDLHRTIIQSFTRQEAFPQNAQPPADLRPQAVPQQPLQADLSSPTSEGSQSVQDLFRSAKPSTTTPEPQWSAERAMYSFSSDQQDKISDLSHTRSETRSGGTVRGSYSYSDGYVLRHVQYIADKDGYRILGESSSPLSSDGPMVDPSGRAAVQADVDGLGYSYIVRGEDIYRPNFRTRQLSHI